MAAIAQLHDGTQIHFPDGMPDDHIDAAVKRHMGLTPPAPADPDVMTALMAAIGSHASGLAGQRNTQQTQAEQGSQKRHVLDHKTNVVTSAAKVDAINGVSKSFEAAIAQMTGPLQQIASNGDMVKELIMALNNVSDTIGVIGKNIIDAIHAPKQSVIEHDENNVPRSVTTSRPKKTVV